VIAFAPGDVILPNGEPAGGAVKVSSIGIFVGPQEKLVDPSEIASTFLMARVDDRPILKLHGIDGRVLLRLVVDDLQAARAVSAELDVPERAPRFGVAKPVGALFLRTLARVFVGLCVFAGITVVKGYLPVTTGLAVVVPGILGLALFRQARMRRVTVGDDGLTIAWPLSRQFVPYDCLTRVEREGNALTLTWSPGTTVEYALETTPASDDLVAALHEHLAVREAFAPPSEADRLALNGRTVEAWRSSLRKAAPETPGKGTYRSASATDDTHGLWAVAEHPFADPMARAGAALELAPTDDAGRARLRVAAARSASLELGRVLEQIASGNTDPGDALARLAAQSTT
jgi:hypothetical protein